MTDYELLRQYVEGSQTAFTALVRRHFDLVHSAAMRQLRDPHAAEDVCQRVFLILAKKSKSLGPQTALAPWLYNATRYACLDALKQRDRRQRHERKAAEMATRSNQTPPPHNAVWDNVEPVLDGAMSRLSGSDRRLLLLRYWESRSTEEVAVVLNVSVDAAKKRLSRAVDRLRGQLARMGVTVGTEVLPVVLIANVVKPAPAGLAIKTAAAVTTAAISAGGTMGTAGALKGAITIMAWTKAKIVAMGLVALCVVGGGAFVVSNHMRSTQEVVIAPASGNVSAAPPTLAINAPGSAQWRARFEAVYALAPGELVKRVAPPFIPERKMMWETDVKDLARMMPDTDGMWMKYGYNGSIHWEAGTVGKPSVGTALEAAVGLRPYEVEGPVDAWGLPFPGDVVVREGATKDQKLAAIQPLISEAVGKSVVFEKEHVTRNAIIMTGQYHPIPAKKKGNSPYEAIDISTDSIPGKQYTTSSSFEGFCGALEMILRMRVVDQRAAKPAQMATFRNNNVTRAVAEDPQKLSTLLSNLSRQTGVQFSVEPRELNVWVMTVGQGPATQPVVMGH